MSAGTCPKILLEPPTESKCCRQLAQAAVGKGRARLLQREGVLWHPLRGPGLQRGGKRGGTARVFQVPAAVEDAAMVRLYSRSGRAALRGVIGMHAPVHKTAGADFALEKEVLGLWEEIGAFPEVRSERRLEERPFCLHEGHDGQQRQARLPPCLSRLLTDPRW